MAERILKKIEKDVGYPAQLKAISKDKHGRKYVLANLIHENNSKK